MHAKIITVVLSTAAYLIEYYLILK